MARRNTSIAGVRGANRQRGRRGARARARERRIAEANKQPTTGSGSNSPI